MTKQNNVKNEISEFHIPRWNEIPNIDLYLDQTVTLLEKYLESYIDENEKLITKTMINNYVKQQLLTPPINKKYNKQHIATLFIICILKQVYSITDISNLLKIGLENYTFEQCYNKFCIELEKAISTVFKDEQYINKNENIGKEITLLQNVVFSFANKLYVKKFFVNNNVIKTQKQ